MLFIYVMHALLLLNSDSSVKRHVFLQGSQSCGRWQRLTPPKTCQWECQLIDWRQELGSKAIVGCKPQSLKHNSKKKQYTEIQYILYIHILWLLLNWFTVARWRKIADTISDVSQMQNFLSQMKISLIKKKKLNSINPSEAAAILC